MTVELADHVAVVEMHRPPNNFFDVELVSGLADAHQRLDDDLDCRAIVLCAQGKHFCAGADFSRPASNRSSSGEPYTQAIRLFRARKPVVAAIHGAAIGGGLRLALSAGFRVASPSSKFAANCSQLGLQAISCSPESRHYTSSGWSRVSCGSMSNSCQARPANGVSETLNLRY
ncbi:enoyl-CoA hydratase/isomerase family protein [Mycobacterium sp. ML4]